MKEESVMEWNYTDEAPTDMACKKAGQTVFLSVQPAAEVVAWADVPRTDLDR